MQKTKHTIIRQKQRGITDKDINIVLKYGKSARQKGGSEIICFSRKQQENIKIDHKNNKNLENLYLIVDGDLIVTVAYKYRKLRRLLH